MTAAIKARGEVAFCSAAQKEGDKVVVKAGQKWSAGDGVVVRFTNSDLKRIEAELGDDWFSKMVETGTQNVPTIAFLETLAKHGAKKDGKPYAIPEEVFDDIPVIDMGLVLLDAACVAMKGKTAREYFEEIFAALSDDKGGADPSPSSPDGTSSTISDVAPSGPASA